MEKAKRNERIAIIIRTLCQYPNRLFTLSHFCEMFGSAKSTISEDIVIARDVLKKYGAGEIQAVTGAAGGVRFLPMEKEPDALAFIQEMCAMLCEESRILPGGYIYTVDVLSNPVYLERMGNLLARYFLPAQCDFVATVETKGIPIALMTARALGKPLVILRRDNKLTEGSVITINYVSASTNRIQTMSLSTRAVKKGQKAVIIDDFMKGGGTLKAIRDLLREFEVQVMGAGVVIDTSEPRDKLLSDYVALMELKDVNERKGTISIVPSARYFGEGV